MSRLLWMLFRIWFRECGIEKWRKGCEHVEIIEREYIEKGGIREDAVERIIIQLKGNSSDKSESDVNPMLLK